MQSFGIKYKNLDTLNLIRKEETLNMLIRKNPSIIRITNFVTNKKKHLKIRLDTFLNINKDSTQDSAEKIDHKISITKSEKKDTY